MLRWPWPCRASVATHNGSAWAQPWGGDHCPVISIRGALTAVAASTAGGSVVATVNDLKGWLSGNIWFSVVTYSAKGCLLYLPITTHWSECGMFMGFKQGYQFFLKPTKTVFVFQFLSPFRTYVHKYLGYFIRLNFVNRSVKFLLR